MNAIAALAGRLHADFMYFQRAGTSGRPHGGILIHDLHEFNTFVYFYI